MTLEDLCEAVSLEADKVHYAYYDYDNDALVKGTYNELKFYAVKYIYPRNSNELVVEVEKE